MNNKNSIRKYGQPPYRICLVHGGPGAAGEMESVAQTLSSAAGILEPFQTADSVQGQIDELRHLIEIHSDPPMIMVGFSWGAWLSCLFAARHPDLVQKLVLISSGPFDKAYAPEIQKTRMSRFSLDERKELEELVKQIQLSDSARQSELFKRIGTMIERADAYDPVSGDRQDSQVRYDIYEKVWPEADSLRRSGELIKLAGQIQCPVTAIHGDYDPHPWKGVKEPLSRILNNFQFYLLENCGHKPWIEKQAKERFFEIFKKELL